MDAVLLTSGAYQAKSVIASAQRCVNLYPEANPQDTKSPTPTTHYPRPGKRVVGSPTLSGAGLPDVGRGLYTASNGQLFAIIGTTVYYINPAWQFFVLGQIDPATNPTSMSDNGQFAGGKIVLVDGSLKGYTIDMTSYAFSQIVDSTGLFTGADIVQYLQTFFLFNTVPNTQNFIISQSDAVTFDALDIAAKASFPDNIATIGIRQREVWLMGTLTTEPWYLSGATDFPFEAMPATFVNYGVAAKYSVVFADVSLFWVSRNTQGKAIIVKSDQYQAVRISTHAIENEIQKYATIEDAVGSVYQMDGHTFLVYTFPTADKTWVYDIATKQWHQYAWVDDNGVLHRDRALFYQQAYGTTVALDWETGTLYEIDPDVYTDDGREIYCIRGFPTLVKELNRVTHWALRAYMECGTTTDPNSDPIMLNMVYSDDGGKTWSDPMQAPLGATGKYDCVPQFTQLGMARERVYELFWTADVKTALNAVYVDPEDSET